MSSLKLVEDLENTRDELLQQKQILEEKKQSLSLQKYSGVNGAAEHLDRIKSDEKTINERITEIMNALAQARRENEREVAEALKKKTEAVWDDCEGDIVSLGEDSKKVDALMIDLSEVFHRILDRSHSLVDKLPKKDCSLSQSPLYFENLNYWFKENLTKRKLPGGKRALTAEMNIPTFSERMSDCARWALKFKTEQ